MTIPKRYISLLVLLASVPMAAWVMAYKPINSAVAETASEIKVHTSRLANFPELKRYYLSDGKKDATYDYQHIDWERHYSGKAYY